MRYTTGSSFGNQNEFILELAEKVIALTESQSKILYRPLPEDDPMQRKPNINIAKRAVGMGGENPPLRNAQAYD